MKGLLKQLLTLCLIFSVMHSFLLLIPQASVSGYTIYTRITDIEIPPSLYYPASYPKHTIFEFEYALEIINTSGKRLYIRTYTTCLVFILGNLSFEIANYTGSVWGPESCGNAFTNHTIEPGISVGHLTFKLLVNDTLQTLPNGNFTIWIWLDDCLEEHNYIHFSSTISVNETDTTITYEGEDVIFTFPSVSDLPVLIPYFLAMLLIGSPVIILLRKRILAI